MSFLLLDAPQWLWFSSSFPLKTTKQGVPQKKTDPYGYVSRENSSGPQSCGLRECICSIPVPGPRVRKQAPGFQNPKRWGHVDPPVSQNRPPGILFLFFQNRMLTGQVLFCFFLFCGCLDADDHLRRFADVHLFQHSAGLKPKGCPGKETRETHAHPGPRICK